MTGNHILCRSENQQKCELRDVIQTFGVVEVSLYISSSCEPQKPSDMLSLQTWQSLGMARNVHFPTSGIYPSILSVAMPILQFSYTELCRQHRQCDEVEKGTKAVLICPAPGAYPLLDVKGEHQPLSL